MPPPSSSKRFVAYYRVSTLKQGASGPGFDAQRSAVRNYCADTSVLLAEFIEVDRGKRNNRPQLQNAGEYTKDNNAVLLIAKLDRLSRNAAFILTLQESGIDFVCADMPDANTLTIGIFAVLAQYERELIAQRTADALRAAKERGVRLGTPANLTDEARRRGREIRVANARTKNATAREPAKLYREKGMTLARIAEKLIPNPITRIILLP